MVALELPSVFLEKGHLAILSNQDHGTWSQDLTLYEPTNALTAAKNEYLLTIF